MERCGRVGHPFIPRAFVPIIQRLGMGVAGAVGLTWEDPVETRRRRQVSVWVGGFEAIDRTRINSSDGRFTWGNIP